MEYCDNQEFNDKEDYNSWLDWDTYYSFLEEELWQEYCESTMYLYV